MSSTTEILSLKSFRPYQNEGADFLFERDEALLLLRMGGGKTAITLTALEELFAQGFATNALIVAPKAVCNNTWASEHLHWSHTRHLTVTIAVGDAAKRRRAVLLGSQITVINYDNIQWLAHDFPERRWDVVVMDEITRFNNGGKRYAAFRKYLDGAKFRWGLTGSLAASNLMHTFYPVQAVDRGASLGASIYRFRHKYFTEDGFSWEALPCSAEQIASLIKPMCFQPDPSVYQSQLPDIVYQRHEYPLSSKASALYTSLAEDYFATWDGKAIDVVHAGALGTKLAQVTSGFMYSGDGSDRTVTTVNDTRLAQLQEILDECEGEPVLIWYWFAATGAMLAEELNAPNLLDVLPAWNRGEVPIAICHPRSGGHGINAQAGGSRMVWYEHTWSAEERQQAEARLHRQGQGRTVFVHDLFAINAGAPTIDHAMEIRREGKATVAAAVMEVLKATAPEGAATTIHNHEEV